MNSKTTITHALRDGELEHVVVLQGIAIQSHTSRVAAMCALMLAFALTGCTFCRTHDTTCAAIGGIAVVSVGLSFHGHGSHTSGTGPTPTLTTLPVDCTGGACR